MIDQREGAAASDQARRRRAGLPAPATTVLRPQHDAVLELQRAAGNRAVARELQRTAGRGADVRVLPRTGGYPAGQRVVQREPTRTAPAAGAGPRTAGPVGDDAWKQSQAAAFKAAQDRAGNVYELYSALLKDAATTAGIADLPGFDPTKISPTDGETAAPGLNLSMDPQDKPGHTGWINESGKFGIPLQIGRDLPKVKIGIIINAQAMTPDKARAVAVVRHEMMHAKHHILTLDAIRRWHQAGRKKSLDSWVDANAAKLGLSEVDRVLIKKGAQDLSANTEVLAYVEGFITQYHAAVPTKSGAAFAFFELLGAVQTDKKFTWQQAHKAVKGEAMGRLRSYYGTLDRAHQELWRAWVRAQLDANTKDTTGRKDFLNELATFVR